MIIDCKMARKTDAELHRLAGLPCERAVYCSEQHGDNLTDYCEPCRARVELRVR